MMSQYGLYAYGLAGKSPQSLDILGIDKQNKVFSVAGSEISVLVSLIDIDQFQLQVKSLLSAFTSSMETLQQGTGAILQAHEDVIDALMQDTTVVPLKFGTILKDEHAALTMLQDEEEKFKSLLAKFTGRVELGLKLYADKQTLLKHVTDAGPQFKNLAEKREKLSRGTAYLLGRKIEEEAKDHAAVQLAEVTEAIFQALGKEAYEAKMTTTLPQKMTQKNKEMILNAAFLVEKENVAHFCHYGQTFMAQYTFMGLDHEVSGPWPPYNFT